MGKALQYLDNAGNTGCQRSMADIGFYRAQQAKLFFLGVTPERFA